MIFVPWLENTYCQSWNTESSIVSRKIPLAKGIVVNSPISPTRKNLFHVRAISRLISRVMDGEKKWVSCFNKTSNIAMFPSLKKVLGSPGVPAVSRLYCSRIIAPASHYGDDIALSALTYACASYVNAAHNAPFISRRRVRCETILVQ